MASILDFVSRALVPFILGFMAGALITLLISLKSLENKNKGEKDNAESSHVSNSPGGNDE